ncbi:MAG TPA: hypothetical protein VGZ25_16835, partial [Gemmataceae bacterium]|nr:hypothetical protein [Gemmataceae bacterium]
MARPKPSLCKISELAPGQFADFFALLSDRAKGATREGKPFFTCRFRDAKRSTTCMVWADSPWFELCEKEWQEGRAYKIRGTYQESERYGPQIDIQNIRLVTQEDESEGFDPVEFVEHSKLDSDLMLVELKELAATRITDEPLRRLVLTLLDRHGPALKHLPATVNKFYPFAGGLLEHTLSVAKSCLLLVERYCGIYSDL